MLRVRSRAPPQDLSVERLATALIPHSLRRTVVLWMPTGRESPLEGPGPGHG
ncbi:MAG: hypothetical protein VW450_08315 [Chloroflexota bacterium]